MICIDVHMRTLAYGSVKDVLQKSCKIRACSQAQNIQEAQEMSYYSRYVPAYSFAHGDWKRGLALMTPIPMLKDLFGTTQRENTQNSLSAQIDYEQYLKRGNERALSDWHKNVPGRSIKYPEFSYSGQIRRADTSITRAGFDYDTASANYYGNLPYRVGGLYGISSRLSRHL